MKAIVLKGFGGPEVLHIEERPMPVAGAGELLVKTYATGMNRADLLQRLGKYPAPLGASDILGLEIAGEVVACGPEVKHYKPGDRIFGLVSGGGYAEYCLVDQGLALPIPDSWSYTDASAVMESFVTANETVLELGGVSSGDCILIHAGGSGVGTAGIQMARAIGATVWITAGSEEKIQKTLALGAHGGINYKIQDFVSIMQEVTKGQGVDIIEDFIGAGYFDKNLSLLKPGGRLIQVGLLRGNRVELDLRLLMDKHIQIKGFILRKRSIEEKRAMVQRFAKRWMPALEQGILKPVVDAIFPVSMVQDGHRHMESNLNFGKVILSWMG